MLKQEEDPVLSGLGLIFLRPSNPLPHHLVFRATHHRRRCRPLPTLPSLFSSPWSPPCRRRKTHLDLLSRR
jgi:hypothetical protein